MINCGYNVCACTWFCRIISKSPYSSPATPRAEENSEETKPRADGDDSNADHGSISLSPFPSRLGYFFPVSANKDLWLISLILCFVCIKLTTTI